MSEERRKRQEERDSSVSDGKTKKAITYVYVFILLFRGCISRRSLLP